MDLSLKSKEKSLSLRNLKEKMSIKGSISDKFSKLKKSGQPKYSGENQVIIYINEHSYYSKKH